MSRKFIIVPLLKTINKKPNVYLTYKTTLNLSKDERNDKTKYKKISNIYITLSNNEELQYLTTFEYYRRRFIERNLTKLFNVDSPSKAIEKLKELKIQLNNNIDPDELFKTSGKSLSKQLFKDLVIHYNDSSSLSENTKKIRNSVFNKHLSKKFNSRKIQDITSQYLEIVFISLAQGKNSVSLSTLKTLKKTLAYCLKREYRKGNIKINPIEKIDLMDIDVRKTSKESLGRRLSDSKNPDVYKNVVKYLYITIMNITLNDKVTLPLNEIQTMLLFSLMCARRRSEILEIRYEDITNDFIIKPKIHTTKTNIEDEYPIPNEIIKFLNFKKDNHKKGLILPNMSLYSYNKYMKKIINDTNISLHNDNKITGHDSRNFFLTIMSNELNNPFIVDSCISHSNTKYKMISTYYTPLINERINVFEKYWNILRNK